MSHAEQDRFLISWFLRLRIKDSREHPRILLTQYYGLESTKLTTKTMDVMIDLAETRRISLGRPGRILLAAVLVILLTGAAPPNQTQGHRKMVSLLSRIAARSQDENIWLGDREVRIERRRLKELGPFATPDSRWRGHFKVGMLELRLGNEAQAIEHLRKSYELLPIVGPRLPEGWDDHTLFELGVAYLRMGETQNCCLRHNPESCILPIRGWRPTHR